MRALVRTLMTPRNYSDAQCNTKESPSAPAVWVTCGSSACILVPMTPRSLLHRLPVVSRNGPKNGGGPSLSSRAASFSVSVYAQYSAIPRPSSNMTA